MFTSIGLGLEDSFASDINNDTYELGVEYDIDNKLVNSQNNEILEVDSQDDVLTATERAPVGNTFRDIQNCINGANPGDVIRLSGNYSASDNSSRVAINKKVTITSSSTATLDGKGLCGIFNVKSDGVVISNLKFINGKITTGGAIRISAVNVTISDCEFEDNHAYLWGGGAIATDYNSTSCENLKILNCNFTNNHGNHDDFSNYSAAGAVAAYSKGTQIINCIFDSNWIKGELESYGGALQIGLNEPDNYCLVDQCIFKNNRVIVPDGNSHGGAGCVRNGVSYTNCLFVNNTAGQGGALTFHASGKIANCTFINNTAEIFGGAISSSDLYETMILKIMDCIFEGNNAPDGGAVQAIGWNVHLLNSTFNDNYATNCGGAVNIVAKDVNVDNSNFYNNSADVDGGAIYVNGENTQIMKSSFISNHAFPDEDKLEDGLGGAIYVNSTQTLILQNNFKFNTARNGSAIYYGKMGENLTLADNVLFENQAWVYHLPIFSKDIYYGETEEIKVILYGGNNIGKFNNLAVSNAIYNAAGVDKIEIDSETPISGATDDGRLYQDSREYNMVILLTVSHEDGTVVYNDSSNSNYLGEINVDLTNLKPGKYFVSAKHFEDTYYKGITNVSSFNVYPKVDNKITISTTNSSFNFEDVVIWTVNLTNLGPNNSTGVIAYNIVPEGLILLNHTFGDKYDPKTGKLDIGELNVGENLVYTVMTVVNKTGNIANHVNITSNETDIDLSNNFDGKIINIPSACDLSVMKTASNIAPNYKDHLNWTITVSNNGPDTAHDVYVVDLLPDSLIYLECDGDYDAETGMWNIGTLENGESVKLIIQCLVNKTGLTQNNVTVNGSDFDYDITNNQDEELIFVNPASDLAIEKTVNASNVNYRDTVKWTLVVTNDGPDDANNVKIVDVLPEGFIYISSTLEYTNNSFSIDSVNVGDVIEIEILSYVNATGEFVNVANVTSDCYDFNLTNNEDDEPIVVNPACDLSVVKEVSESNPNFDDEIVWTITVRNDGPDAAHNVTVNDALSKSLIWVGDDSSGRYNHSTGVLSIDCLEVGEEFELNIECLVKGTGLIGNNVSVNCSEHDYNLTNNQDNETIDVEKSADVWINKIVNQTNPNYGDLITWTLIISNKGPDKATNIYVEDSLPEGLILVDYVATKGFYDNGLWVMCCLENGEEQRLDIITRVNATGEIANLATIHADEYDSNTTNNQDNESIDVPLAVDVGVMIEVDNSQPSFGESVVWQIKVVNNGPDNATDVVLHEVLPHGLVFVDYNSTKGVYSDDEWKIGSLNVGETQYLNISTITDDLGEIINPVDVESEQYDWNKFNNKDVSYVNVKPVADLSVEKSVDNAKPKYGEMVKWTILVSNHGPNVATNVIVHDVLSEGMTFVRSNGKYSNGVWNVGNIDVGQSKTLEIICKVSSTGNIVNTVNVSSDELDPNLDDNFDDESISSPPASDLSITKIASKYKYGVGDVVEYVIEIVNNGPDTAHNIKVIEILDDLLKLKSYKVTMGKFNRNSFTWTIESLGYGEYARLYVKAIAMGEGILKNSVVVTSDTFDYDLDNNNDYAIVNVSKNVFDKPIKDIGVINKHLSKNSDGILKKHVTGNPFFTLVLALVFALIFFEGNISKRR